MPWRDIINVHPAAELFPLMEGAEFEELVADIKKHGGLKVPLVFWKDPVTKERSLLDGRNRLSAVEAAIGEVVSLDERGRPEVQDLHGIVALCCHDAVGDPREIVVSLNVHRRHLTQQQKRDLIDKVLESNPQLSNNAIAEKVRASDTTVAARRAKLEANSRIENKPERTEDSGRRARGRKPGSAKKPSTFAATSTSTSTPATPRPPASRKRDLAIAGFLALWRREPRKALGDLGRIFRDDAGKIAAIPIADRVELTRAPGVSAADLRPIGNAVIDLAVVRGARSTDPAPSETPEPPAGAA